MFFASRYIGGVNLSRSHKGDKDAKPPITFVDAAKQRETLKLLEEQVFSSKPFQVPPELYQFLAKSNWSHWGSSSESTRSDFPAHDVALMWQERVLDQVLSSITLRRIIDNELKTPPDQDAFTSVELIEGLTAAIFAEIETIKEGEHTTRKPAIDSLRRNLQRTYLEKIGNLAMGRTEAPEDCQTVAYAELSELQGKIDKLLKGDIKLDAYSRAHLMESSSRIGKIIDARLTLESP
jgi:hypothetical protein